MAIDVNVFKKRFGRKPVDPLTPQKHYEDAYAAAGDKIRAAVAIRDGEAIAEITRIQAMVKAKDFLGARDAVDTLATTLYVDRTEATRLQQALAVQEARVQVNGKLLTPMQAPRDAISAEIAGDRYDQAATLIGQLKTAVDKHIADLRSIDRKLSAFEPKADAIAFRMLSMGTATLPDGTQGKDASKTFLAKCVLLRSMVTNQSIAETPEGTGAPSVLRDIETMAAAMQPADTTPDGLKAEYDKRRLGATEIDRFKAVAQSTDPLLAPAQASLAVLVKNEREAADAYAATRYGEALDKLDAAGASTNAVQASLKGINDALSKTIAPYAGRVGKAIKDSQLPSTLPPTFDPAPAATANTARTRAAMAGDYLEAIRQFALLKGAYALIWSEMLKGNPGLAGPVTTPVAQTDQAAAGLAQQKALGDAIALGTRDAVTAALNAPGANHKAMMEDPANRKALDDMVAAIGSKADSTEKRLFVQSAMKARFGLKELTGEPDAPLKPGESAPREAGRKGMSTKALPRLYSLFAMLPPSHTTENSHITSLERRKENDTSWHAPSTNKIVLKAGKTDKKGGSFDNTTLHEIAHGVDAKFGFMNASGSNTSYGGWKDETYDSIRAVATGPLGFFTDFPTVDRAILTKYIDRAFAGSDPASLQQQFQGVKDASVKADTLKAHPAVVFAAQGAAAAAGDTDLQRDLAYKAQKMVKDREPVRSIVLSIIDQVAYRKDVDDTIATILNTLKADTALPDGATWQQMAVHPAVDFAGGIRLKGGASGLWYAGDGAVSRYIVNGRVYQESYQGQWVSYLASARAARVSDYQFRAPAEWFAEVYAAYFRGKLASSHPLTPWLDQQKGQAVAPVRN